MISLPLDEEDARCLLSHVSAIIDDNADDPDEHPLHRVEKALEGALGEPHVRASGVH